MPYKDPERRRACQRESQVRRLAARRARGICVRCPRKAEPGRSLCPLHLFVVRNMKKRRMLRRHERGLCLVDGCPDPHRPGATMCGRHEWYYKKRYAKWRAEADERDAKTHAGTVALGGRAAGA